MATKKAKSKRFLSSSANPTMLRRKKNKRSKRKGDIETHGSRETTISLLYKKENDDLVNMINSTKRILERIP